MKTYKLELNEINGFPSLGILEKTEIGETVTNHRWLLNPNNELPIEIVDEEVISKYNEVFTQEVKDAYIMYTTPNPEERAKQELEQKIMSATSYLKETDWVENYKTRHDLGLETIPLESSKWIVINKREEYKVFLKGVN